MDRSLVARIYVPSRCWYKLI